MTDEITFKDVALLGAGALIGFATSYYFHVIQKSEGEITQVELIAALDRNYEQALVNGVKGSNLIYELNEIEAEVKKLSDLPIIKEQLDNALRTLKSLKKGQDLPINEILRYKSLGDRWSEVASLKLDLKIIDNQGNINLQRLLSVHKNIFPENFPWAGRYRNQHVYVIDQYGTVPRVIDVVQAESKTATIAPELIDENLNRLFNYWNGIVGSLFDREAKVKIDEVSKFHHEFELIHPFIDGNGRIGRMILEEQLSFLFQLQLTFRPDNREYYSALRMMNMGNNSNFYKIIAAELKKYNIQI